MRDAAAAWYLGLSAPASGLQNADESASRKRLGGKLMRLLGDFIFLVLFFALAGIWLVSWAAFHVAGGMIHLLLVLAVIFLVLHLFRGRQTS